MLLVDTSIWIELLNSKLKKIPSKADLKSFAVCPPVIQEVVQGISDRAIQAKIMASMLGFRCLSNPVTLETYLLAADLFSTGRRKGFTIRSATDCLIAAIAIQHKTPILHQDRDFEIISKYTDLETRTKW